MKLFNTIIKLAAAIAAVAGIAYLVYKYMDAIKAWLNKLCPCTDVELEDDFEIEIEVAEDAPAEETAEEAPVVEEPAAEAPAEEVAEDNTPVADEADFEV